MAWSAWLVKHGMVWPRPGPGAKASLVRRRPGFRRRVDKASETRPPDQKIDRSPGRKDRLAVRKDHQAERIIRPPDERGLRCCVPGFRRRVDAASGSMCRWPCFHAVWTKCRNPGNQAAGPRRRPGPGVRRRVAVRPWYGRVDASMAFWRAGSATMARRLRWSGHGMARLPSRPCGSGSIGRAGLMDRPWDGLKHRP